MKILLDNGHGFDTPGKRSPDGHFREYAYNRYLAFLIRERLTALGLDAQLVVPEREDISLKERCRRVNAVCKQFGNDQVILLSIHVNAAGNGQNWLDARGWSCFTTRGKTKADALATCLYEAAKNHLPGMRLRTDYTDRDPVKPGNNYFKAIIEFSQDTIGRTNPSHHDVLFIRHTDQKDVLKYLKADEYREFIFQQLLLSREIIQAAEPKLIVVLNAAVREIFQWLFPFDWESDYDKEIGAHMVTIEKKVPVLFSGMLSGQRALDIGSKRALKWHIQYILDVIK